MHSLSRGRVRLVALATIALGSPANAQAQWPTECREVALYTAARPLPHGNTTSLDPLGNRGAQRLIPGFLKVFQRNDPNAMREDLVGVFRRAERDDSTEARLGLAFLVVNGDVLLPRDFDEEALSWLYYEVSGDPIPVLYFVETGLRPEARLRALRAIRAVAGAPEQRLVLKYACDAAWLLLTFNADKDVSRVRPGYPGTIDARFLMPHAMRLLPAATRLGFVAVAQKLLPPPMDGRAVLLAYTGPSWEWGP